MFPIRKKLTFSRLRIFKFKKFVSSSVFGELHFAQISLNFKTPSCNLQIRGLGKKNMQSSFLFNSCYTESGSVFPCEKALLKKINNINNNSITNNNRKRKFPLTVL